MSSGRQSWTLSRPPLTPSRRSSLPTWSASSRPSSGLRFVQIAVFPSETHFYCAAAAAPAGVCPGGDPRPAQRPARPDRRTGRRGRQHRGGPGPIRRSLAHCPKCLGGKFKLVQNLTCRRRAVPVRTGRGELGHRLPLMTTVDAAAAICAREKLIRLISEKSKTAAVITLVCQARECTGCFKS